MLLVRSLINLRTVDPGFQRDGVLLVRLFPQPGREKLSNRTAYYRELAGSLSSIASVESVSYAQLFPGIGYEFEKPLSVASSALVGPGFFRLMRVHIVAGREFDWRDDERAPRVAIVTESLARRLYPGESALGKKIKMTDGSDRADLEIVGVAGSASLWRIQSREPMAVFAPLMQQPSYNHVTIEIRTTSAPSSVAAAVRRKVESMGHHYPLRIETLKEQADNALTTERTVAILSACLGGLALIIASVGLYGLMAYSVTLRAPELGVRMALGAHSRSVLWLILYDVLRMTLAGLAVGIPAAWAASRLIAGMLFGISEHDLTAIALSLIALLGAALLAGYLPARRASRIDSMTALRCE